MQRLQRLNSFFLHVFYFARSDARTRVERCWRLTWPLEVERAEQNDLDGAPVRSRTGPYSVLEDSSLCSSLFTSGGLAKRYQKMYAY